MKTRFTALSLLAFVASSVISSQADAVLVFAEAESGSLGVGVTTSPDTNALGGEFIEGDGTTTTVSGANTATYNLDIPAGTYDLYVRLFVGPQGGSDDSFFVAPDFGVTPSAVVNQLGAFNSGFYTDADGNAINGFSTTNFNETYYWLNLSDPINAVVGNDLPSGTTFTTTGGPVSYSIATREDGLRIDAIAFGLSTLDFSVADLDAAGAVPEPSTAALGALVSCALGLASARRRA